MPPSSTNNDIDTSTYIMLTIISGFKEGKVIFQKLSHGEAPSILDASYKSGSILFNPAIIIKIGIPAYHNTYNKEFIKDSIGFATQGPKLSIINCKPVLSSIEGSEVIPC